MERKRNNWKNALKRKLFILSFIIVPTVHFLLFYVSVNISSVLMAFQKKDVSGKVIWTLDTMKNTFARLFPLDEEMRIVFKNTFLTFGVQLIMFFVGFFVAYFIYKKIFLHKAFRFVFFLPTILPVVMFCSVYSQLLSAESGIAVFLQKILHLSDVPQILADSRYANIAVLLNMVWLTFPGNLLIWSGSFSRIPDSVIESARLDGVTPWLEAFKIIIPMVWPTFVVQFILLFAGIFGASGNVFLLTGGGAGTQTFSNWMYIQVYATTLDPRSNLFNSMSALGLVITVIASAIALTLRKITDKMFGEVAY